MSRYGLKPKEEHQDKEVFAGFDATTGYFFGQVFSSDGNIIKELETTNGHILAFIADYCDPYDLLTKTVSRIILLDVDPSQSIGMFHSWEDFTTEELYKTKQTIG